MKSNIVNNVSINSGIVITPSPSGIVASLTKASRSSDQS